MVSETSFISKKKNKDSKENLTKNYTLWIWDPEEIHLGSRIQGVKKHRICNSGTDITR
jgi:hypothetical protein